VPAGRVIAIIPIILAIIPIILAIFPIILAIIQIILAFILCAESKIKITKYSCAQAQNMHLCVLFYFLCT